LEREAAVVAMVVEVTVEAQAADSEAQVAKAEGHCARGPPLLYFWAAIAVQGSSASSRSHATLSTELHQFRHRKDVESGPRFHG
jgi:hypothetical protein